MENRPTRMELSCVSNKGDQVEAEFEDGGVEFEAGGEQKGSVQVTFLLNFFDDLRRRVARE
jgi:hypothetical protein